MKTPAKRPAVRPVSQPVVRRAGTQGTRSAPVLSAPCLAALRDVVAFTRAPSCKALPGAGKTPRAGGADVRVLFTGQNPPGALLAAQTLAKDLELDLLRIDLNAVVSPYIGETEKNLRRIFAAAERKDVILFFDEADALLGRRTGVKDSHDRYANLEVSYLLTRMEEFGGVVVLSTQRRKNLDEAFLRRFQFVVSLPPGKTARRPKPKSAGSKAA